MTILQRPEGWRPGVQECKGIALRDLERSKDRGRSGLAAGNQAAHGRRPGGHSARFRRLSGIRLDYIETQVGLQKARSSAVTEGWSAFGPAGLRRDRLRLSDARSGEQLKGLRPSEPAWTKLARRSSEVWLGVWDEFRNWLLAAARG